MALTECPLSADFVAEVGESEERGAGLIFLNGPLSSAPLGAALLMQ